MKIKKVYLKSARDLFSSDTKGEKLLLFQITTSIVHKYFEGTQTQNFYI